ncbi:uracil-DNA glycosylase, partial [Eubacteriales bacterium OttesenSCG-928-A19]|nr:uracil-DNA glycosylase [Eubacteriales bacterium OttesenSCG-928-A19]
MKETIAEINRHYAQTLGEGRRLVMGEGDPHARLMLVGEAPGAQEAELGRPFVGTAGKHLDAFLAGVGLAREALYITNAVKFRPTRTSAKGRLSNRTPTRQEIAAFRPWLLAEIKAVQPLVIATLGNTALRAVT